MNITAVPAAIPDDFDPQQQHVTTSETDAPSVASAATTGTSDPDAQLADAVVDESVDEADGPATDEFEVLVAQMPELRVEYVDPRVLADNPRNLRASLVDVEDLK